MNRNEKHVSYAWQVRTQIWKALFLFIGQNRDFCLHFWEGILIQENYQSRTFMCYLHFSLYLLSYSIHSWNNILNSSVFEYVAYYCNICYKFLFMHLLNVLNIPKNLTHLSFLCIQNTLMLIVEPRLNILQGTKQLVNYNSHNTHQ